MLIPGAWPLPELAAVVIAATGFSMAIASTAGAALATSAAPRLTFPLRPPEAVRQDSATTLGTFSPQIGLFPSWSSVPISMPFTPMR